jgi:hypothetical protein
MPYFILTPTEDPKLWELRQVETPEGALPIVKEIMANGKVPKVVEDMPYADDIKYLPRHSVLGNTEAK